MDTMMFAIIGKPKRLTLLVKNLAFHVFVDSPRFVTLPDIYAKDLENARRSGTIRILSLAHTYKYTRLHIQIYMDQLNSTLLL